MPSQGKRLSILSLPEVQEVYSVPQFDSHERDYFFTFTDEELDTVKSLHSHRNRIHFLLILGYFKVKPVRLIYNWKDIEVDYRYLVERYYPTASKKMQNIARYTKSRLYKKIFDIVDYQYCDNSIEIDLITHLITKAKCYVDETQLFKDAVNFLKSKLVAIPRYSTLQKVISKAINTEETRLARLMKKHLTNELPFLCLIDNTEKKSRLNDLKKLTRTCKPSENKRELKRHQILSELSAVAHRVIDKLKLSEGNIRYFAARCQQYDINRLRELKKDKALIYLTCFIVTRFRQSNDSLTQSFLASYKEFNDLSIEYRDECVKNQALALSNSIESVPHLLKFYLDENIKDATSFGSVRHQAFNIIPQDKLTLVTQQLANVKPDKNVFQWKYVDDHFNQVIRNIRPLLIALNFGCRNNTILKQSIETVKTAITTSKKFGLIDGRLLKTSEKKYLKDAVLNDEENQSVLQNRNEFYLYRLICHGIRNGDVFVKNSLEHRNFDDYLVNDSTWRQRKENLNNIGLGWMIECGDDHLMSLENLFRDKITSVGGKIIEGKNSYIKRKQNSDKLLWSKAVTAKDDLLTEKFFSHFDRKTIVNVIRRVDKETNFLEQLKPKSNRYKKSVVNIENLLACLLANGTFQGTHKFSALSDQQYKVLKRIEDDCFHGEALRLANDTITSQATRLPIFNDFRLNDNETHSSADGQRYECKHGNPLVGHAAKYYGKKKGTIVYTLVASHFATQGKVISARSHESHHLFDVVYNNTSDLKTNIVSTDTHGTNQFNHAILHTFGYQFTPRYAGFKKRFLAEFNVNFDSETIFSLAKPINWKLIKSEWDNIVKIMLSLGMRTVQQSTLVKKLCSYKKCNSTMLALTEYNRVLKCLHLLDYANDKQLRQVIQESLNRGESFQGLRRALSALGGNQFRGRSPDEMNMWNSCANLLANCIVYYNAMIMSSFKLHCIKTGNTDQIRFLQRISPASWENIILNGYYDLSDNDELWDIESEVGKVNIAA